MAIETEKKYRLTAGQQQNIVEILEDYSAVFIGEDFETNLIFGGEILEETESVIRIRQTARKNTITYKKSGTITNGIKNQIEHETEISDPAAMQSILENLDLFIGLVYEKRRRIWKLEDVEIAVDELPFGLFAEIEGERHKILQVEMMLEMENFEVEAATYPYLTKIHGTKNGRRIEALFSSKKD